MLPRLRARRLPFLTVARWLAVLAGLGLVVPGNLLAACVCEGCACESAAAAQSAPSCCPLPDCGACHGECSCAVESAADEPRQPASLRGGDAGVAAAFGPATFSAA